jgi:hypothetical protein
MYALEMDEEQVEAHLYQLLGESNGHGRANGKRSVSGKPSTNGKAGAHGEANGNGKVVVAAK